MDRNVARKILRAMPVTNLNLNLNINLNLKLKALRLVYSIVAATSVLLWNCATEAQLGQVAAYPPTQVVSGGGSNPSVAHHTAIGFQSGGCSSGCNITVPSTVAGNAFAVSVINLLNTANSITVTDTHSDTCTQRASSGNSTTSGESYVTWFICPNIASGNTTVTITNSGSTDSINGDIYELTNVASTGTIYEGGNGGANASSTSVSFALASATTHANDIILLSGIGGSGSTTGFSSPTSPWVFGSGAAWYQQGTGTGTYSGTLTVTGSATTSAYAEIAVVPPGGGPAAPSVIHFTEGVESGGCGTACNITIPATTAGNLYLFIISDYGNDHGPVGALVGSEGCTEVSNSNNVGAGGMGVLFFACLNITGGQTTASYQTASTGALLFDAYEISGAATSSAFDMATGNYASSGSVSCSLGPTTQTNELIIVSGQGSGSSAWTSPTSPWAAPIISGGSPWTFSQVGVSLTTYNATVTATGATEQACAMLGIHHS